MVRFFAIPNQHQTECGLKAARYVWRSIASLGLAGILVWLLSQRVAHVAWSDVSSAIYAVSALHWGLAAAATMISFWAVGHYDAVLHRHFATGLPENQTRRAGICAIALGQTIGLGVVTGAVIRWRLLPEQSFAAALRLTVAVAISFLAGWAVVTAAVLVALPRAPAKECALAVLVLAAGLCVLCICARPTRIKAPNMFTLSWLLGLCAVDTGAAALAFYLLCPNATHIPFVAVLPAFLLAYGAGLLSAAPGGVGAFELTLVALLPALPAADLLGAVLAWRLLYYAIPALLAAAITFRGPKTNPEPMDKTMVCVQPGSCAQNGLVNQGEHQLIPSASGPWLAANTKHLVVGLFDPGARTPPGTVDAQRLHARAMGKIPVLYHAKPRKAALARRSGFVALRVAQEAWLTPCQFDLDCPARAGLRRKLRRANTAGVTVTLPDPSCAPPWHQLDQIAQNWAKSHGGERGFSMGRYTRAYVRPQRIYTAWVRGQAVAFVTFHQTNTEWALDLMRHEANLPDGVMHLLVHTAIEDAARNGVARLSLAAIPDIKAAMTIPKLHRLICKWTRGPAAGLAQFKSSFAPDWRALYLCAPSHAALLLAVAEIAREVFWPKPLHKPRDAPPECSDEQEHEEYEFASGRAAWHRQSN